LHKPRCECPECFTGRAHLKCVRKPGCKGAVPSGGSGRECQSNRDCAPFLKCRRGACIDPCIGQQCSHDEKCVTQDHAPVCACKGKLVINVIGELVCPRKDANQCHLDEECPSHLSCIAQTCQNPCLLQSACEPGKVCQVLNHQPLCMYRRLSTLSVHLPERPWMSSIASMCQL
jgi:hypothetical protein